MNIVLIAGARPNFMKIAPIARALDKAVEAGEVFQYKIVHTGQHYDPKLSQIFFDELNIPKPDINLEVGSGSHAQQSAEIIVKFENYLQGKAVDLVIVVGDVNSTLACTIVAKKMGIKVAHVEGGIRSFDLSMPEEINRMVTDSISDYFFTTSEVANENLMKIGVEKEGRIFFVGNTMIDTLIANEPRFKEPVFFQTEQITSGEYFLLTIHRPFNADDPQKLEKILRMISEASDDRKIVFPAHPRTRNTLSNIQLPKNIIMAEPLGYLHFLYCVKHARAVVTDSGGIQEETTYLKIPCLTLRNNTERPETASIGTNILIKDDLDSIKGHIQNILAGSWKKGNIPPLWDGKTSGRIVEHLLELRTEIENP